MLLWFSPVYTNTRGDTTMTAQKTQHATAKHTTETEFCSEAVYANTNNAFTKVQCGDVYGFRSIATSGDYSETTEGLGGAIQFGVEITYPNGKTEILAFQLRNILNRPKYAREQLYEKILNNGEIWVADFEDVFEPSLFPKTWGIMIAPTEEAVEDIHAYANDSRTSYHPNGKEDFTRFFGGVTTLLLTISGFGIGGAALGGSLGGATGLFIGGALGLFFSIATLPHQDALLRRISERYELDSPYGWVQREEPTEEEFEDMTPLSSDAVTEMGNILRTFDGKWENAHILSIDESHKTTTLTVITEGGMEISIDCPTVSDGSDRFLLNRLVEEIGVGSVQQLEDEEIEVGIETFKFKENEQSTLTPPYCLRPIQS